MSAKEDRAAMIERFSPISTAFSNLQRAVIGWNVSDYSVMKLTTEEIFNLADYINKTAASLEEVKRREVSQPELKRRLNGR